MILSNNPLWLNVIYGLVFMSLGWFATQIGEWCAMHMTPHSDGPAPNTLGTRTAIGIACAAAIIGYRLSAHGGLLTTMLLSALVICGLILACWTDLRTGQIPPFIIIPIIAIIIGVDAYNHEWSQIEAGLIVAAPFAAAALISKNRGVGWGDVEIVTLGGLVLGLDLGIFAFAAACFASVGVTYARKKIKEPIAFIPYLATAIALAMLVPTLVNT